MKLPNFAGSRYYEPVEYRTGRCILRSVDTFEETYDHNLALQFLSRKEALGYFNRKYRSEARFAFDMAMDCPNSKDRARYRERVAELMGILDDLENDPYAELEDPCLI